MREDIVEARMEKLKRLKDVSQDPYPEKTHRTMTNRGALESYDTLSETKTEISLVGRIRSVRVMGSVAFAHIEDETAKIQVFLKKTDLPEGLFKLFEKSVDLGDFVEIRGTFFTTKQGEKTICAKDWRMLSKSMRPIPTEHFGIKDEEELLRRRYLDLLVNSETREMFRKKNIFWQTIRTCLIQNGFLEVQTPVLENIPGGADAEPFTTHHNALDRDFFLRISLELALKRLLVGGFERVFEIGRVFRNEGIDREHLQEFDHMEFYWAYADMAMGMKMVEDLYKSIVYNVTGGYETFFEEGSIQWGDSWPIVDYFEAFLNETGVDLSRGVSVEDLKAKADEFHIQYEPSYGRGRMIDTLYKKTVRPKIIQPCFLVGHPYDVSPLAKQDTENPLKVLRFQPIAVGSELGNGFAELNDPIEQRRRFEEQMKLRKEGDNEAQMLDDDFLEALEYGMPPACGFGMSERFFAILMNRSIRETVIFPPMKGRS